TGQKVSRASSRGRSGAPEPKPAAPTLQEPTANASQQIRRFPKMPVKALPREFKQGKTVTKCCVSPGVTPDRRRDITAGCGTRFTVTEKRRYTPVSGENPCQINRFPPFS